jgi:hypothetical protein
LADAAVVDHDDFNTLRSTQWTSSGRVSVSEGRIEMAGAGDWDTRLGRNQSLSAGTGALYLLRYTPGADFVVQLNSGEWETPSWKAVSFGNVWWASDAWQWNSVSHNAELTGPLSPTPDKWYYLLFAIDKEGTFLVRTWERDDPTQKAEYRWNLGTDWDGLSWDLTIMAHTNALHLDSYTKVSFSEIQSPPSLPSPVTEVLADAVVADHDDFDTMRTSQWAYTGKVTAHGTVTMVGTGEWGDTGVERKQDISAGQGVLLLFKYSPDTDAALELYSGGSNTRSRRCLSVYPRGPSFNVSHGDSDEGGALTGNLESNPDKWYYALLAFDQGSEFLVQMWERDDPSQKAEARWTLGPDWEALPWRLNIMVKQNTLYLDSLIQVSFSEIK